MDVRKNNKKYTSLPFTEYDMHELGLSSFLGQARVGVHERVKSARRIAKKDGGEMKRELFLNIDDALQFVLKYESVSI